MSGKRVFYTTIDGKISETMDNLFDQSRVDQVFEKGIYYCSVDGAIWKGNGTNSRLGGGHLSSDKRASTGDDYHHDHKFGSVFTGDFGNLNSKKEEKGFNDYNKKENKQYSGKDNTSKSDPASYDVGVSSNKGFNLNDYVNADNESDKFPKVDFIPDNEQRNHYKFIAMGLSDELLDSAVNDELSNSLNPNKKDAFGTKVYNSDRYFAFKKEQDLRKKKDDLI